MGVYGSQDSASTDWVWIDCNEIVKKSRFKHFIRRFGSLHIFFFLRLLETLVVFENDGRRER